MHFQNIDCIKLRQAYNIMNEEQFQPTQTQTLVLLSQTLREQTVGNSEQRLIRLKKDINFVRTLIDICLGKHIESKFKQLSLVIIKNIVVEYFNQRLKLQVKCNSQKADKKDIFNDSQIVKLILSNLIRVAYQLPDVNLSKLICSILLKFVSECSIWDLSQLGLDGLQCETEWQKYVYVALVLETVQFYSNSITQGANKNKVLQKQIGIITSISEQQMIKLKACNQGKQIQTMTESPANYNILILLKCLQILHFAVNPSFQQVASYIYPALMIASITLQTLLQFQNISNDIQNVQLSIHFCLQIIKQSYCCSMDPVIKNSCQAILSKQCCQNSLLLINALLQNPIVQIQKYCVHLPDSISKCLNSIALAQPDAKILILSNSSSILRTLLRYFVIDPHEKDMCNASFRQQTIKNRQGIISLIQIILQTQSQLSLQICAECKFSDAGDCIKMELPLYIIRSQVVYFYSCIRQLIGQFLPVLKICEPAPSTMLVKIHVYEILIKVFGLLSEEQIKELCNVGKIDIVNHLRLLASIGNCPVKNACLQLMIFQLRLLVAIYKHEQPASSNFSKSVLQGYYIILDRLFARLNQASTNHIAQYKQLFTICTELLNFSFDLVQHGQIILKYLFDIYHHQLVALAQSSNHDQQYIHIDQLKDESLIIDLCSQSISNVVNKIYIQILANPYLYVGSKWLYQFAIQVLNLQQEVTHATIENYCDLVCRICFSLFKIGAIVNQKHQKLSISLLRIAHKCKLVIEQIIVQNEKTQIQFICSHDQDFMFDGDSQLISFGQSNCNVQLVNQHIKRQYISANICSVVLTTLSNMIVLMGQQERTQAKNYYFDVSKMLMVNFKQLTLKQKSRTIDLLTVVAIIEPLNYEQQVKLIDFVIAQTRMDKQRLLTDNIEYLFSVLLIKNNSILKKGDLSSIVEYFTLPIKISTNAAFRKLALLAQYLLLEMLENQQLKSYICAKIAAICKYDQPNLQNDQPNKQTGFCRKQETPCIPIDCIIQRFVQQTSQVSKYVKTD